MTYPYSISMNGVVWLEGGTIALHTGAGNWATPLGGLVPSAAALAGTGVDEDLGPFSFLAIEWSSPLAAFTANFTCYASGAAFSVTFPDGAAGVATQPLPAAGSPTLVASLRPSLHFPSFAADASTALRSSALGYAEWSGCMTSAASRVGAGLAGYGGGQESGPLLLFNTTFDAATAKPAALVLGPLAHFASTILALVPDPRGPPASCAAASPDTDQTGAAHSRGYDNGTHTGDAGACCALCESLTPAVCDSWVFDTSGTQGPDCWPCIGTSGSRPAANRTLGLIDSGPPRLVGGVQGYVSDLPPRFTSSIALVASAAGATDAVYAFGALLRERYRTLKMPKAADVMRNQLSYWSDNGAFYEDDYWAKFFSPTNSPQIILAKLKAEHARLGVAFGTYQLDPWWSDGDGNTGKDWYWMANWSAAPGYFPDGLAATGLPLTLYSNLYAAPPDNLMTDFSWVTARVCQIEGICPAHVQPAESYDFHSRIFDVGATWGMTSFECVCASHARAGAERGEAGEAR